MTAEFPCGCWGLNGARPWIGFMVQPVPRQTYEAVSWPERESRQWSLSTLGSHFPGVIWHGVPVQKTQMALSLPPDIVRYLSWALHACHAVSPVGGFLHLRGERSDSRAHIVLSCLSTKPRLPNLTPDSAVAFAARENQPSTPRCCSSGFGQS